MDSKEALVALITPIVDELKTSAVEVEWISEDTFQVCHYL